MEHKRKQGYSPGASDAEALLTLADLAAYLNTSRSTIYRLIREGSLRPIYFDDRPRFVPGDVWAFVLSHRSRR
jgi:predicted DNA-binding transcriptional regulator AlpA